MITSSALEPAPQSEVQASEGVLVSSIRRVWSILFEPDAVVEVRALKTRWGTVSGYFDDPDRLATAIARLDGRASLYVTLNPLNPALLARGENKLIPNAQVTTSDKDITRRRWILFDFDPTRPAGISSTEAQHQAALDRGRDAYGWLRSVGVPDESLVLADSGNGAHVLLRVDLPNDSEARALVERCLQAVALQWSDDTVGVDLKTANAARITKLYGTVAVKGDNTDTNPHRRSSILRAPNHPESASDAVLHQLAVLVPSAPTSDSEEEWRPPVAGRPTFDLDAWLERFADRLGEVRTGEWQGGKKWVFRVCPWDPAHTNWSAYVVRFPGGAIAAGCHHNGCAEKNWRTLRDLFEPDRRSIAANIARPVMGGQVLTDVGNSELFVQQHGQNVWYVTDQKSWAVWDGVAWRLNADAEVETLAKQTARSIHARTAELKDNPAECRRTFNHWIRSEHAARIAAMIQLSRSDPRITVTRDDLDADPWLLNCLNGTLDLRTGRLRPHDRADLITKVVPVRYDPDAKFELWDRFLVDTTGGDPELARFLQQAAGYTLTGQAGFEVLFFAYGSGATGKSTFLDALLGALGDYGTMMNFGSLVPHKHAAGGARSDLVRLQPFRMVASVEIENGQRLAEGLVKMMTGGDRIVARGLYQKEIEFRPQFKLWLAANHQPKVSDEDDAVWRRIQVVPFEHVVPESKRDEKVKQTLRDPAVAGPAILAWAVRGLLDQRANGFHIPEAVKAATRSYRASMDPLQDFWSEYCVFEPGAWTAARTLWSAYLKWAEDRGERTISQKGLSGRLAGRGCVAAKQQHQRGWKGVRLTDDVREFAETWGAPVTAHTHKPAREAYA